MDSSQVGSIAAQNGVPSSLAAAVAYQESGFNNDTVSPTSARGIMQIMPGTWEYVQRNLSAGPLNPSSAADNVKAGSLYLASLLRDTGGDVPDRGRRLLPGPRLGALPRPLRRHEAVRRQRDGAARPFRRADPRARTRPWNETTHFENEEADAAAAEAGAIGGVAGDEDLDPADRPLVEAGEGEAEGFELAEQELVEHASHGDDHSGRVPLYDEGAPEESGAGVEYGESDDTRAPEDRADEPREMTEGD